jgi:hypothetical protein
MEDKETLKIIFWIIIGYLVYDWIGFKGILGLIAFMLAVNIIVLCDEIKEKE